MKQFSKRLSLFYHRLHSDELMEQYQRRRTSIFLYQIQETLIYKESQPQLWDANNVTGRVNSIADRIIVTILGVTTIPLGLAEGLIDCSD